MKNNLIFASLFLVLIFLVSSFSSFDMKKNENQTVKWMSIEEALASSSVKKKKIFIDVYTDWCGWCKVMDKNTFSHPLIANYLNENFYCVKLNAEQKEDINFGESTFKFIQNGRRGYHEFAALLLNNQMSYPSVVFLDENFRMIQPVAGYQKPDQFEMIIKFIGSDDYKNTKWIDWQKTFQSGL